jgi:peptidyl-tRNA hydrolase, PTH1 family
MNLSGRALSGLRAPGPDAPLADLLVLVDDFAIPAGTFRLRAGGSAGGHNGLRSIQASFGTLLYPRLRIGVGPVPAGVPHHDYVLEPMPREDRRLVDDLLPEMAEAVECWMQDGIDAAMNRFNRKTKAGDE